MLLGDWIRNERKKKFPSQHTYAALINISQTTVSLWENNKLTPSVNQLAIIAKSFGKTLKEVPFEKIINLEGDGIRFESLDLNKLNLKENSFIGPSGEVIHLTGVIGVEANSGKVKVIKPKGGDVNC